MSDNYDHLPTINFYLNVPSGEIGIVKPKTVKTPVQTFSAAPVVAQKASNRPFKTRSLPVSYASLSEKDKALYDRCVAEFKVSPVERLHQKLFDQVAGRAEKI